jgi:hypothetical protein
VALNLNFRSAQNDQILLLSVPSECKIAISHDWRGAVREASFACFFFSLPASQITRSQRHLMDPIASQRFLISSLPPFFAAAFFFLLQF